MHPTLSTTRPLAALISVPLDAPLHGRLDRLAARRGQDSVALVAEAIAEYVDRRDRAVPSWVGAARRQAHTVDRARRTR